MTAGGVVGGVACNGCARCSVAKVPSTGLGAAGGSVGSCPELRRMNVGRYEYGCGTKGVGMTLAWPGSAAGSGEGCCTVGGMTTSIVMLTSMG